MTNEAITGIDDFYTKKLQKVSLREIRTCPADMPIFEVARIMAHDKISCVFITAKDGKLIGFISDITLRDEVVAKRRSFDSPISDVMDPTIISISQDAYVYEALLLMFQTKTRYLLVEQGGQYVGMVSRNRILTEPSHSPFVFIQSVKQAVTKQELRKKWGKVPQLVYQLIQRGVRAELINQIISTVADTILLRVIENVVKEKGTPPAKFVFFILGSEGRMEQTLKTDQDNAIIYEDKANEQREKVRAYFLDFAKEVSERLDFIGFAYCTGGYMAQNPSWTHSLSHWKSNYERWFLESSPDTLMNYATFFDCRPIYGDFSLLDQLKDFMKEQLENPLERFFFNMAQNALQFDPQLTWLKNIRTFKVENEEVFDIKKAMSPMVEAIRIYALKEKIFLTNTGRRLNELTQRGVFDNESAAELYQAYYYLMALRLEKQAERIIHGKKSPQNYIPIRTLTKVQEATLREIFKVIKDLQLKIKIEFTKSF
nr:CBS domain-containing protein [Cytophagales bacterium]